MKETRKQVVSNPDNWLYNDIDENNRQFEKGVYLGKGAPEWLECTNQEKIDWEEEHGYEIEEPIQEPEVIENKTVKNNIEKYLK